MALEIYYNTGDNNNVQSSLEGFVVGQTFTTVSAFTLESVKFKAWRFADPGTVTAEIYATSAGLPTGSVLASGTMVGSTITDEEGSGQWYSITLSPLLGLAAATKYAMAVYGQTAGLLWRLEDSE